MNTWMDTREKVFAYIREHHMLQAGDRVVAGVSGGADSVCLLFLLLEWQKEVPTDIAVVHVDHGIRAEAGEDARYVEQLCEERRIPFFLTRAEVRNRARMEKISEEEAGRRTRYEAFEKAAKEWGATKIAVAHNSNDRSETQLFHLFRGSGIRGLVQTLLYNADPLFSRCIFDQYTFDLHMPSPFLIYQYYISIIMKLPDMR